ncbi:uncharacterized protein LOC142166845 [Nicotiana tabacum]|uniref:Uncharacterized protein LOC142166845 n=1 Tax=Nicotiana tabacum TaxID=4097 RepID=A0AC58SBW5_TOBAC
MVLETIQGYIWPLDGMCIVSDRHESIAKSASTIYPEVKFKKSHNQLAQIFFKIAKAYTINEFNNQKVEIETIDKRVKEYLFDVGYDKWSRAHSKVNRTTIMTSNMAKSINSATKSARDLSVTLLLDFMTNLVKPSNKLLYRVYDGGSRYVVCMEERKCNCRIFQLDELPCLHALAIIKKFSMDTYH